MRAQFEFDAVVLGARDRQGGREMFASVKLGWGKSHLPGGRFKVHSC